MTHLDSLATNSARRGASVGPCFIRFGRARVIAVLLAATLAVHSLRARTLHRGLPRDVLDGCVFCRHAGSACRHGIQAPGTVRNSIAFAWNDRVVLADLPQAPHRRIADFLPWLVPFWMAGVVLFYLRHLASWAMARRLRRTGVCAAPDFWQERLSLLAGRLRLSRPVKLLESGLAGVPVVMGHLRPVILMPVGLLTGLPAGQIESILLHELAHIRRDDYLVNMLQTSVEGLLFYHPVVWWISGVIRTEREHCCDDLAVALERRCAPIRRSVGRFGRKPLGRVANRPGRYRRKSGETNSSSAHSRPGRPSSALTPFVSAGILMITAAVGLTAGKRKVPRLVERGASEPPQISPYANG